MSDGTSRSYQRFFAELKRRHVFRVMAVYGVVGFVLMQVMELALPALLLPEWTYRLVALLLLVGFPITLIITWAFEITPDGIKKTRAASPREIEAIVAQPATRRWPSGVLALIGLGLLVGGWWAGRQTAIATDPSADRRSSQIRLPTGEATEETRPSLAVLPFADMSPGGDQEYFSDGITEELSDVLSRLRELTVVARTSAFAFKDQNLTAPQLGDTLGVAYLLEGSVRKSGERLRITAQLIDARDGSHLWSKTYDRDLEDVFAVQSEVAAAIARELRLSLGLHGRDLVRPTVDLEAYDLYLAGRAAIRERGPRLKDAARLLEAAIAQDSGWAPAWAGLAETFELMVYYPASWEDPPVDSESRLRRIEWYQTAAENAAKRALSLDPDNASARIVLGSLYRNRRRWSASEREYLEALKLDPDNAEGHHQYADMLGSSGRVAEALAAAERAVRLDAVPIRLLVLAGTQMADGRSDDALESLARAIALDPDNNVPFLIDEWYRVSLAEKRFKIARRYGLPSGDGVLDVTLDQHRSLRYAMERGDPALLPPAIEEQAYLMVALWQRFDDRSLGLIAVEEQFAKHPYTNLIWLWLPSLDPLRDEVRFRAVLRKVNLEGVTPQRTPDGLR